MTQPASAPPSNTVVPGQVIPPASAPTPPADAPPAEEGVIFNADRLTQAIVITASAICFWMFWVAGEWVNFPIEYKHSGSVLYQNNGVLKIVAFWAVLLAATAIATVLSSWRWFLAGLFSACIGAAAWTIRGGMLRHVLFSASSPSVFLVLAVEQILLGGGVAAMWLALWQFRQTPEPISAELKKENDPESPPGDPIFAIATQTLAMGIIVLLLAATDSVKQVNAAVFIGAAGATALSQYLQKKADNVGRWYWVGPIVVGLIGYIGCYLSPRGWDIGLPTGTFAPLARPLPICYASFGMAGALFGFWSMETALSLLFLATTAGHVKVRRRRRQESESA